MRKNKGIVYLVGAGPGDPGLLTLRAQSLLARAEVVVYDRLVNPKILAYAAQRAESIFVGKASSRHTLPQDGINKLLVKLGKRGKMVVRLKGGDPFVFGRGGEEALALRKAGVDFEIVPGVTSAIAVPAYAGIPVTQRGYTSSLGIFTGQEDPTKEDTSIDWAKISTGLGTLVFLMGFENLEKITRTLVKHGRKSSTPCCLIQWGTLPKQRSVRSTLKDIVRAARENNFSAPAILVVGEVALLKKDIEWFEKKPLFGRSILVTVPSEESGRLCSMLEERGAGCVDFPLIEIQPLEDYYFLDSAIRCMAAFDWVIFTSRNGVRFFFERLAMAGKDARWLHRAKVAAIGPKTAEALKAGGIAVDTTPKEFRQEGLLERLKKTRVQGKKILIVRAQEARDVLPSGLRDAGASVSVVPAYRTKLRDRGDAALLKGCDLVTFTSSSCVEGFVKVFGKRYPKKMSFASIGPVTSATCRSHGIKVAVEAKEYTLDGLAAAISSCYGKR